MRGMAGCTQKGPGAAALGCRRGRGPAFSTQIAPVIDGRDEPHPRPSPAAARAPGPARTPAAATATLSGAPPAAARQQLEGGAGAVPCGAADGPLPCRGGLACAQGAAARAARDSRRRRGVERRRRPRCRARRRGAAPRLLLERDLRCLVGALDGRPQLLGHLALRRATKAAQSGVRRGAGRHGRGGPGPRRAGVIGSACGRLPGGSPPRVSLRSGRGGTGAAQSCARGSWA
jgi:hypothetical protein